MDSIAYGHEDGNIIPSFLSPQSRPALAHKGLYNWSHKIEHGAPLSRRLHIENNRTNDAEQNPTPAWRASSVGYMQTGDDCWNECRYEVQNFYTTTLYEKPEICVFSSAPLVWGVLIGFDEDRNGDGGGHSNLAPENNLN